MPPTDIWLRITTQILPCVGVQSMNAQNITMSIFEMLPFTAKRNLQGGRNFLCEPRKIFTVLVSCANHL